MELVAVEVDSRRSLMGEGVRFPELCLLAAVKLPLIGDPGALLVGVTGAEADEEESGFLVGVTGGVFFLRPKSSLMSIWSSSASSPNNEKVREKPPSIRAIRVHQEHTILIRGHVRGRIHVGGVNVAAGEARVSRNPRVVIRVERRIAGRIVAHFVFGLARRLATEASAEGIDNVDKLVPWKIIEGDD